MSLRADELSRLCERIEDNDPALGEIVGPRLGPTPLSSLGELVEALLVSDVVHSLELDSAALGDDCCLELSRLLTTNISIVSLSLRRNAITDEVCFGRSCPTMPAPRPARPRPRLSRGC